MTKRVDWRAVKKNRAYTYEEAARRLAVHKNSVKNWVKREGLEALTEQRPHLILGSELQSFLQRRMAHRRSRLALGEMYCFGCKAPRSPAGGMVEDISRGRGSANFQAICPECNRMMFRRVRRAEVTAFIRAAETLAMALSRFVAGPLKA